LKTVFITGSTGRLGTPLTDLFRKDEKYEVLAPPHSELDVADREAVFKYVEENPIDITVHLAAMVSPPKCEENKELSWRVTVEGTINLIDALEKYRPKSYFVLMSTPCVFSGEEDFPKSEHHYYYPDNFYGLCKAMQEMVVRRSKLKWLIIRGNFIPYKPYPYKKAFIDRRSNYLFAHQLAKGIKEVVDQGLEGIVHVLGDKVLSMYELAKLCPNSEDVEPYTLEEYYKDNPGSCKLTKSMVMKSTRWKYYSIEEDLE